MKNIKYAVTVCLTLICFVNKAQVMIDDNFDSYPAGSYLSTMDPSWMAMFEADLQITSTLSASGSNSVHLPNLSGVPEVFISNSFTPVSSGEIVVKMAINVEQNSYGGFRLHSSSEALSVEFLENGAFRVSRETGGNFNQLMTGTYSQGIWFNFELAYNLDFTSFTVKINGTQIGQSVAVPSLQTIEGLELSSFTLDPNNTSTVAVYIDNLKLEKFASNLPTLDLAVDKVEHQNGLHLQSRTVRARFRNSGQNSIASFNALLKYDGIVLETVDFSGLNIQSLATYVHEFSVPVVLENGKIIEVVIVNINAQGQDDNQTNDNLQISLANLVVPANGKKVLMEFGTGSWCGPCIVGNAEAAWASETFPDHLEVIKIHEDDPLASPNYTASGLGMTFFPTKYLDRLTLGNGSTTAFEYDLIGWESGVYDNNLYLFPFDDLGDFYNRISTPPVAMVNPTFVVDTFAQTINVSVEYEINASFSNYKVACAIKENSLIGVGQGWNQANSVTYLNGPGGHHVFFPDSTDMYDEEGSIVGFVHKDVARSISPDVLGGDIIASAIQGDVITKNFTFAIDPEWDLNDLEIVAMIIDNSGFIDNIGTATLGQTGSAALYSLDPEDVSFYPNPVNDILLVRLESGNFSNVEVEISQMDGKVVRRSILSAGESNQLFSLDFSTFESGQYIIRISANGRNIEHKVVKY